MDIKIESVSDLKQTERGPSCKIKASDGKSYYVNEDCTSHIGKTVEVEVTEKTSAKGNKYNIAKILKVHEAEAATPVSNGGPPSWAAYAHLMKEAHNLALELEPDGLGEGAILVDRSQGRAAIVNTIMIAFSNGKIKIEEDPDTIPF